eukprot:1650921-Rhodomonas_salina.3
MVWPAVGQSTSSAIGVEERPSGCSFGDAQLFVVGIAESFDLHDAWPGGHHKSGHDGGVRESARIRI